MKNLHLFVIGGVLGLILFGVYWAGFHSSEYEHVVVPYDMTLPENRLIELERRLNAMDNRLDTLESQTGPVYPEYIPLGCHHIHSPSRSPLRSDKVMPNIYTCRI